MQAFQAGPRSVTGSKQVFSAPVHGAPVLLLAKQTCHSCHALPLRQSLSIGSWHSQPCLPLRQTVHIAKSAAGAVPAGEPADSASSSGSSSFTQAVFNVVSWSSLICSSSVYAFQSFRQRVNREELIMVQPHTAAYLLCVAYSAQRVLPCPVCYAEWVSTLMHCGP